MVLEAASGAPRSLAAAVQCGLAGPVSSQRPAGSEFSLLVPKYLRCCKELGARKVVLPSLGTGSEPGSVGGGVRGAREGGSLWLFRRRAAFCLSVNFRQCNQTGAALIEGGGGHRRLSSKRRLTFGAALSGCSRVRSAARCFQARRPTSRRAAGERCTQT